MLRGRKANWGQWVALLAVGAGAMVAACSASSDSTNSAAGGAGSGGASGGHSGGQSSGGSTQIHGGGQSDSNAGRAGSAEAGSAEAGGADAETGGAAGADAGGGLGGAPPFGGAPDCDPGYSDPYPDKKASCKCSSFGRPGADFAQCNLSTSGVDQCNSAFDNIAVWCSFGEPDLRNDDFRGTNFSRARWVNADLTGADMTGANLSDASFSQLYGCPAHLPAGYECVVDNPQQTFATVPGEGGAGGAAPGTSLPVASWMIIGPGMEVSLGPGAHDFHDLDLHGAGIGCETRTQADGILDFSGANLTGAFFVSCDLTGTDFTGALLDGITWTNTTCPDGSKSDVHGSTCAGYTTLP